MGRNFSGQALVVSLAAVLLAGCVTSTTATVRTVLPHRPAWAYSATPRVQGGRFTAPFELDDGGLLVVPIAASHPSRRSLASVRVEAWATSQLAPLAPYVIGLGRVTITRSAAGVPRVRSLVAWVALAKSPDLTSCTAFTPPAPKVHPPSDGWSAVVIGDAARSPAVVYRSASIICDRLEHAAVQTATEVVSSPWRLTARGVVTTVPTCSTFAESDFGSSPTMTSFRYQVTIPEERATPAIPGSRTVPSCLPDGATRTVGLSGNPEAQGVVSSTLHETTGLLRQVSTVPYRGPRSTGAAPAT